ncbi:MAG: MerR family transcriptional regulator [Nitrospirae bacterium]|nr:MerR family transcriptional regulator [Nitrospirota bacterium]
MSTEREDAAYLIGYVARMLGVHPQTLRIYEREGLLRPRRSERNTRVYSEVDVRRAELVLTLTRDLGINLAGVEVILRLRERIERIQGDLERFFASFPDEARSALRRRLQDEKALVPVTPRRVINVQVERSRKPAAPKRKNAKPERGKR